MVNLNTLENCLFRSVKLTKNADPDKYKYSAEAIYAINFTQPNKRFALNLHCNGSNSFLFVNATKINQSKAKDSEIKDYTLCLGNISKDFTIINMKK